MDDTSAEPIAPPAEQTGKRVATKAGLGLTGWLSILRILALAVGGCWTIHLFLKLDARDELLTREKSEIELRKPTEVPSIELSRDSPWRGTVSRAHLSRTVMNWKTVW